MGINWVVLKAEVQKPEYVKDSDIELLAKLKNNTVTVSVDITTHDIQKYLALSGDLMVIDQGVSPVAKEAVKLMELFTVFEITHKTQGALILGKLDSMLNGLVSDNSLLFTATDKATVLAMGSAAISIEQSLGQGKLELGHINHAREI